MSWPRLHAALLDGRAEVLGGVTQEMRLAREETFGPVVALAPFDGAEATAIELANDTECRATRRMANPGNLKVLKSWVWGLDQLKTFPIPCRRSPRSAMRSGTAAPDAVEVWSHGRGVLGRPADGAAHRGGHPRGAGGHQRRPELHGRQHVAVPLQWLRRH